MENTLYYAGTDWSLSAGDITHELAEALMDCGRPGDAEPAVKYVRENFKVSGEAEACRAMLRVYGAWEAEELDDHEANLDRLVWLTGCSFANGEDAYFSAY